MENEWQIVVTDDDIRAARTAWLAARDGDAPPARTALLRQDLERLWRAQARQIAEEFRARVSARPGPPSEPGT